MNRTGKATFTDVEFDEIVISGMAGRFPESDNIKHLEENLSNKVDLGSDDCRRWPHEHPDIPKRIGKINNIEKFDAEYFDIPFDEAHLLDPMSRCLLEHTYEAIVDAGVNPKDLRGTKTGVIVGTCFSETEWVHVYEKPQVAGLGGLGCRRCMLANRISHWLGTTGPSYMMDAACSSSIYILEQAYRNIRSGMCDDMIVAGANLCLNPQTSLQYARLGALSPDGFCRPFDIHAKGYMRSEAIAVVYLQKAKNAKRIYAYVIHSKTNCDGFKEEGITYPSSETQSLLLQQLYNECNVSPSYVTYIEAHGSGTKANDPIEVNAIEQVFCKNRRNPLLIGSGKSNFGHTEPVSGLLQIFKVVIAMETGVIPPNIHFTQKRDDIEAFKRGTIRVVSTPTSWEPSFVGINSFGFGGSNAHVLLAPNTKRKINGGLPKDDLPRLVVLSGRTEQAVQSFLHEIENQPIDVEYIRLLHDLYADDMKGHPYRGYTIVESQTLGNIINQVEHYSELRKPMCFVFPGIGSQWLGMGEALMQFPTFYKTVEKCDTILKVHGFRIIDILTKRCESTFDSVLNSVIGITVMQLGLINLMMSANIVPDYVIGYSIGELSCGYVTGDFTIEQVILSAYYIGLVLEEIKVMHNSRVDIGPGNANAKDICPNDMKIVATCNCCRNINSSIEPTESMRAFAQALEINEIFYKDTCNNISLHNCCLIFARTRILAYLYRTIPQRIMHSHKWRGLIHDTDSSYAEYFADNLIKPVIFEEIAKLIPENAVVVEIVRDESLESVSKQLLGITNIALSHHDSENDIKIFLQGLGKIYNCGFQPQLANLYPTVELPVSRSTRMISPSIKWKHSETWHVSWYTLEKQVTSGQIVNYISLLNEDYKYMDGHVIDGRNLIPATGYIVLIWKLIGMIKMQLYNDIPVIFENIRFLETTFLSSQATAKLTLTVQKDSGEFEIIEGDNVIVTGSVRVSSDPDKERTPIDYLQRNNVEEEEMMKTKDIYKELRLRGYQYSGLFCSLKSLSITRNQGHIAWMDNWTVFLDNMMQIGMLETCTRNLRIITGIQKLVIDPKLHAQYVKNTTTENKELAVRTYKYLDTVISGGVEIRGVRTTFITRQKPTQNPILEKHIFVAHRDGAEVSFEDGIIMSTHLVLEHICTTKVDTIELLEDGDEMIIQELASPLFVSTLTNSPLIHFNITLVNRTNRFDDTTLCSEVTVSRSKNLLTEDSAILVTGCNLLTKDKSKTLKEILPALKADGFLLTRGLPLTKEEVAYAEINNLAVVLEKYTKNEHMTLLRKRGQPPSKMEVIYVNNYEFSWLEHFKSILKAENELTNDKRIILVGEKDAECGLLGLLNCLRKEQGGELIRGVFIQDENAPIFSLHNHFYAEQLQMDLVVNVLRPGKIWGSYRHFPLTPLKSKLVHHAYVNQMVRGDLTSFRWMEGPLVLNYQHGNFVNIIYASLNFKDIMIASNKINSQDLLPCRRSEDCMIGFEYAGIDNTGQRIMGLYENRCISNRQIVDKYLSWKIPDKWTLEDAATVPCAYTTCYYALYRKGKLKKGDKVLIHSGSGAVGQAAIRLALHEGCEVFTTVGNLEKRSFIRNAFPSIPEEHIGRSRDTSFEQMIYQQTNGRGVDVVLNSLAEDKLQASIRCLARGGCFLEIGKFDMMVNNTLNMSFFSKGIKFYGILLENVLCNDNEEKRHLNTLLTIGLDNGVVKPIVRKVFQKDVVERAFRYMSTGKHIGKIIIKVQEEEESISTPILALPRYYCLPNKSYIILGGLGGFGFELAGWLVTRGANNLVLISRTGIKNGYQRMKIGQWESYGVKILISNIDVSDVKECEHILRTTEELAPIDAIFNLAVVLNDKIYQNHTIESFQIPFKAKVGATKNLDQLSRQICPQLRHFVVFSSETCGRGNIGQSNYAMANSIMERICERRSQKGLHGLAIQWGAFDDIGVLIDISDMKEKYTGGTVQQNINSCIEKLEEFLLQEQPIVASMVLDKKNSKKVSTISVVDAVANIMGFKNVKAISGHIRLPELGMDSLMAVEIKQTLENNFGIYLTAQGIRNLNFAKLSEMCNQEARDEKLPSNNLSDVNDLPGINTLIRVMDKGYSNPDICMDLPTKSNKPERDIFLLPGIDGCGNIFNMLASKIEGSAMCLQYGTYHIGNNYYTITEITNCVLKHILNKIKLKRNFVIVAYSYGALIGIELTKKLEEMNIRGQLVLIDGAPMQIKALMNQYIPYTTIDEFHNNVLLIVMNLLNLAVSERKLLMELNKGTNWDDKLNIFLSYSPQLHKNISIDHVKVLCTTICNRIRAFYEYDITQVPKIMSPITFLKPTEQSVCLTEENYGLHKITKGDVEVRSIEGNHITMLDSDKVAAAINGQ
ncbi:Fatty acid synthase [Harpegnathos saltator]|uniref:Fatty acid synthase n=2 Tax=Harpegnathos saltator TaxID=610380 RepID=E2BGH5_HARSA|nr:Fatty acid synthase [Harpegnathos saltator]